MKAIRLEHFVEFFFIFFFSFYLFILKNNDTEKILTYEEISVYFTYTLYNNVNVNNIVYFGASRLMEVSNEQSLQGGPQK